VADRDRLGIEATQAAGATRTFGPTEPGTEAPPEKDLAELPTVPSSTYTFGAEIARGGMGRISLARDRRLHRPVAIKEVLQAQGDLRRRFEREVLITARLQHPAIVNVYEAGRWPTGEPFLAMKMVRGRSLKEVVADTKTLSDRLALLPKVIQISEALAYAHAERIVHRDLKPSNVLVGDFGETVVIDWGLAKDLRDEDEEPGESVAATGADLTMAGAIMGTPGYMAPEQSEGRVVDERADVFALGAILYFVLTGEAPYLGSSSTAILTAMRNQPHAPIATRVPGVPRDLATIVEKAMARDPATRYPSARELAEELHAFQTGQLVKAHQYSRAELVRRWVGRHRGELVVAGLALFVGALALGEAFRRVVNERDRASEAGRAATARADELTIAQARQALDHDPAEVMALLSNLSPSAPEWGAARLLADEARRRGLPQVLHGHRRQITAVAWNRASKTLVTGDLEGRVWAWSLDGKGREIGKLDGQVRELALSPSGRRVVASWREGDGLRASSAAWWELAGSAPLRKLVARRAQLAGLEFTDEERVVGATEAGLIEWSLDAGTQRALIANRTVVDLDVSVDRRWIIALELGLQVVLFDRTTETATTLGETAVRNAVLSPSARRVALGFDDGRILVRPTDGGPTAPVVTLVGHGEGTPRLCWLDEDHLVSGGRDGDVRIWTLDGKAPRVLRGHTAAVDLVVCAEDGRVVASSSRDATVRLWTDDGKALRVLSGPPGRLGHAVFLGAEADEPELAVAGSDPHPRLYRLRDAAKLPLDGPPIEAAAFSADGGLLVTSHDDTTLRIRDMKTGVSRLRPERVGHVSSLVVTRSGHVVTVSALGEVTSWPAGDGKARRLEHTGVGTLTLSPDEKLVAMASSAGPDVITWDLATGAPELLTGHSSWVESVVWLGPERLASASKDDTVRVWDLAADRAWTLAGPGGDVRVVVGSADGSWVAAASATRVRGYHLPTAKIVDLAGLEGEITAVAFAPRGTALAIGFEDGRVGVWPSPTSQPRLFAGRATAIAVLRFDPRGSSVAAQYWDGAVLQWDVETGEERALRDGGWRNTPGLRTVVLEWSPNGSVFMTGGSAQESWLWRDDLPTEPGPLRAWLREVSAR
jgi:eukaryotic-like serine/threonine-protein kinase